MPSKRTLVKIEFQYKPIGRSRPLDYVQGEPLSFEMPYGAISAPPIPAVGDTVSVTLYDGNQGAYQVLTRHFDYTYHEQVGLEISVNVVVTDVGDREMGERVKS